MWCKSVEMLDAKVTLMWCKGVEMLEQLLLLGSHTIACRLFITDVLETARAEWL